MLDVDLNVALPMQDDSGDNVGTQERREGNSTRSPPIDLDAYDDDVVVVSSTRGFAEFQAKNISRRNNRPTLVVDLDYEEVPFRKKRRRSLPSQINRDIFINSDGSSNSMRNGEQMISPFPAPPPKEPTFRCPVCLGQLVEEMSTKCGHIFCKACIKASITAQKKCPTCRKQISMKDVIRIYLPVTNFA